LWNLDEHLNGVEGREDNIRGMEGCFPNVSVFIQFDYNPGQFPYNRNQIQYNDKHYTEIEPFIRGNFPESKETTGKTRENMSNSNIKRVKAILI